jgi:hypothetical protein
MESHTHTITITLTDDEVRFLVMLLTKVHAEIDADTGSGVVHFAANEIDPGILKTLTKVLTTGGAAPSRASTR